MIIKAEGIGKKFGSRWIFKDIDFKLCKGESVALTGRNGSGKSTLLQIVINALSASKGKMHYYQDDQTVFREDKVALNIGFAAPYIELIEEFTLLEHLQFHEQFKPSRISLTEIVKEIGYPHARDLTISEFSSGMKQRLRLALVFYFEHEVLALDEPTSNLDAQGIQWYLKVIHTLRKDLGLIIASNQWYEYEFCQRQIALGERSG